MCSFFFFKRKTAYEMRISDWSSDVCSSDLGAMEMASVAGHCAGSESPSDRKSPKAAMHCAVACAAFPAIPPLIEQRDRPTKTLYSVAGQKHLATIQLEAEKQTPDRKRVV